VLPLHRSPLIERRCCSPGLASRRLNPGGRGRIRTFVARKERQIYSLLVLATHPPVREKLSDTCCMCQVVANRDVSGSAESENTKRTRVKRHQPFYVSMTGIAPLTPPQKWWSWRRELNPRPSDYKSDALPAELRQRCSNRTRIADWTHLLQ
jgi:hypothetical protein